MDIVRAVVTIVEAITADSDSGTDEPIELSAPILGMGLLGSADAQITGKLITTSECQSRGVWAAQEPPKGSKVTPRRIISLSIRVGLGTWERSTATSASKNRYSNIYIQQKYEY